MQNVHAIVFSVSQTPVQAGERLTTWQRPKQRNIFRCPKHQYKRERETYHTAKAQTKKHKRRLEKQWLDKTHEPPATKRPKH